MPDASRIKDLELQLEKDLVMEHDQLITEGMDLEMEDKMPDENFPINDVPQKQFLTKEEMVHLSLSLEVIASQKKDKEIIRLNKEMMTLRDNIIDANINNATDENQKILDSLGSKYNLDSNKWNFNRNTGEILIVE